MGRITWTPPAGWVEETGARLAFTAPCDCTDAEAIVIGENVYDFVDTCGCKVADPSGTSFVAGALVEALLDCENKRAFAVNTVAKGLNATLENGKTYEQVLLESVCDVVPEYYASTSPTEPVGGEWDEVKPETDLWIWVRDRITNAVGDVTYSEPLPLATWTSMQELEKDLADVKTAVDVLQEDVNLRVEKDDLINQINLSTEGVKINAQRIELGQVHSYTDISPTNPRGFTYDAATGEYTIVCTIGSAGSELSDLVYLAPGAKLRVRYTVSSISAGVRVYAQVNPQNYEPGYTGRDKLVGFLGGELHDGVGSYVDDFTMPDYTVCAGISLIVMGEGSASFRRISACELIDSEVIVNGSITTDKLSTTDLQVGGWNVSGDRLQYRDADKWVFLSAAGLGGLWCSDGQTRDLVIGAGTPSSMRFGVDNAGGLFASDATITGGLIRIPSEYGDNAYTEIHTQGILAKGEFDLLGESGYEAMTRLWPGVLLINSEDMDGHVLLGGVATDGAYFYGLDIMKNNGKRAMLREHSLVFTNTDVDEHWGGSINYRAYNQDDPGLKILAPRVILASGNDQDAKQANRVTIDDTGGKLYGTWGSEKSISVFSDRNKKRDIEALPEKYSTLFDQLRPVSFRYKDDPEQAVHTGFIAQEVKDAMDAAGVALGEFAGYVVSQESDGSPLLMLRYEAFVTLCVQEIQKLKKQLQVLSK